ncbi:SGNH/GDSL hydrolase family protein [Grimontia sp. NTOU-MAR1]|uniref:SGNH/GDSL hydrolase family protein n=1 Tax=Grimontia sp. NTOU-MAR1 TaxID=3111011 RepID=UPI002DB9038B|nr:SGNH/GDSL hydrolase family protein [Grimontia sp. NTOU-MAR1]WRW00522.1 SGNH/GDSL hydrolase family protein [Grimontia sp. NTOU-MAR1]
MQRILCFGDSNTWGYNPSNGSRWGEAIRWTSRLKNLLNNDSTTGAIERFEVLEEGLNGRTTVWNDPIKPYRDGSAALPMILLSHRPLNWVVIMLGTNDLKSQFPSEPAWIAEGIRKLIGQVKECDNAGQPTPRILIVSPAPMHDANNWASGFHNGRQKSLDLATYFRAVAEEEGCDFFEAATVCEASPIDGLHLDEAGHAALADALTKIFR